jgi:UDP-GlcNAc:undecaprenyl-phosphate/decaprenyl-phosphate GlcNAc-1-phosphate transferase
LFPYLAVLAASAGAAFIATPLVRRLAIRFGAIDHPSDRKVHPLPTPTLGGVAIFLGLVAGVGASRFMPFFSDLHRTSSEIVAVVVAAAIILVVGVVDDVRGVDVASKLSGQVLAAGILVLLGVQLLWFWLPGPNILSLGPDLAVPLTVLWVLAMMNAVNLIDGLDGLAAGIVIIAAGAFFVYTVRGPSPIDGASTAALFAAVTAGSCLGFLPWNLHPARIFMGDSGSMLLGLLLAASTISGVGRNPSPPAAGDFAVFALPVLVPLFVLAVPFLDVALAIARRVRRRRPVTHPDKEHIHHRLMDLGHSHRQAVLLLYLWSALISGCALAVGLIDGRLAVSAIVLGALAVIGLTLLPGLRERRRRNAAAVATPPPGPEPARPLKAVPPLETREDRSA